VTLGLAPDRSELPWVPRGWPSIPMAGPAPEAKAGERTHLRSGKATARGAGETPRLRHIVKNDRAKPSLRQAVHQRAFNLNGIQATPKRQDPDRGALGQRAAVHGRSDHRGKDHAGVSVPSADGIVVAAGRL
jgi:hypothetical protein